MQRKIWSILAFLLLTVSTNGCNSQITELEQKQQTIEEEDVPLVADATNEQTAHESTTEDNVTYAFQKLTRQEKQVYDEILDLIGQQTAEGKVSTRDADTVKKIFQCVMDDHPEYFYVNGYQYKVYSLAGKVTRILIQPSYTMDAEKIASAKKKIDAYTQKCMQGLDQEASDYAKVRYLYEYVILNTEYKNDAVNSQNICSVFINHESVCQGYAKALQYLCQQAGLQTGLINGSLSGVGHAWNLIKLEDDWYYVDVTLGDASYVSDRQKEEISGRVPPISYDYLCITSDVLLETHTIDNVVPVPECHATKCNYYVQENLLFDTYDEESTKALFKDEWENGDQYITIKCTTLEVYETVKEHLISQQKVFSFVGNHESTIGYAQNETLLTLSFWTL